MLQDVNTLQEKEEILENGLGRFRRWLFDLESFAIKRFNFILKRFWDFWFLLGGSSD